MLDETRPAIGLARELARINLTLATYTQWYWKIDLHNLLHFLSLRADAHAQYEIRVYAEAMLETVRRWVPLAHARLRQEPAGRGDAVGAGAGGGPADARGRAASTQPDERAVAARMARADGGARATEAHSCRPAMHDADRCLRELATRRSGTGSAECG